jgi:hypothetical protein
MAGIKYVPFDGARVSKRWAVVLKEARDHGVEFHVNSGHRTMREQLALFKQNMRWTRHGWAQKPGRPLTAFPAPLAPHVRTGNPAHALDLQHPENVAHWLRVRRIHVAFPVSGESWHLEIGLQSLTKLWRRYR